MSEVILLDTHIWFWIMTQDFQKFPAFWREEIETARQVGISSISCYEIALAQKRGRLELPCPILEWFEEALTPSGISLFPLTPKITAIATDLSNIHKDPFDRLIIATALEYNANLASVDRLFSKYPELENYLFQS